MDSAFAFYLIQSYDEGARIAKLYDRHHEMAPLNDTNTNMFQAYLNIGKCLATQLDGLTN